MSKYGTFSAMNWWFSQNSTRSYNRYLNIADCDVISWAVDIAGLCLYLRVRLRLIVHKYCWLFRVCRSALHYWNQIQTKPRKKYFSYFIFDDWPGIRIQAFTSNKPTNYILDHVELTFYFTLIIFGLNHGLTIDFLKHFSWQFHIPVVVSVK